MLPYSCSRRPCRRTEAPARHDEDAVPAAGYAERNLAAGPSAGEGVINLLTSSHEQVRSDVVAAMRRLAEVLGSCASALDASVKMYD